MPPHEQALPGKLAHEDSFGVVFLLQLEGKRADRCFTRRHPDITPSFFCRPFLPPADQPPLASESDQHYCVAQHPCFVCAPAAQKPARHGAKKNGFGPDPLPVHARLTAALRCGDDVGAGGSCYKTWCRSGKLLRRETFEDILESRRDLILGSVWAEGHPAVRK